MDADVLIRVNTPRMTTILRQAFQQNLKTIYVGLFAAAWLLRNAHVTRGDYSPWWDGVGWSYADVWISRAVELAYTDATAGFNYAAEGMVFVPPMAAFIKLFGMQGGMMGWTYALITLSALIAPIAASTVYQLTRHVSGAVLAGGFVVIDPVLRWFGVNGWSDSMTMFFTAVAFWGFASTAARPTKLRGIIFGGGLGMLALSHTTWLWPCVLWAVTAWPLLLLRHRWLPTAVVDAETRRNPHWIISGIPLVAFFGVLLLSIGLVMTIGGSAGHDESIPIFAVDSNNQRALVISYDPSITWHEWKPSDTIRVLITKFIPAIPRQTAALLHGHLVNVIPGFAWLVLLVGISASVIGLRKHVHRRLSVWALMGLAICGVVMFHPATPQEPSVMISLIVVAMVWLFVPVARILLLVSLPIIGLLMLYMGITTQQRHSNAMVYVFYLISGITFSIAVWDTMGRDFIRNTSLVRVLPSTPRALASIAVIALVIIGAGDTIRTTVDAREETAYLKWLGTQMHVNDVLFTTGNVNPWSVHEKTGRTVYYDVRNTGRLIVDSNTNRGLVDMQPPDNESFQRVFDKKKAQTVWRKVQVDHSEATSNLEILASIRENGAEVWFYSPGPSGYPKTDSMSLKLHFIGEPTYPIFAIVPRIAYPDSDERFGYVLDATPTDLNG